jgi:glycerol-1-phosphate dehydrogenase [NAD(P)+]
MHFDITKRDGKLILDNLSCDCAYDHNIPDMDIYIKSGLVDECADCIKESGLGTNVLLIADNTTYAVAGERVENNLKKAGLSCRVCILPGEHVEPTPEMADYIVTNVDNSIDFLLAVGSGVVTDLTRRSAFLAEKPFAAFGTAASMDGYTSITSSMMINKMKVSMYGNSARLLMFDPAILATAPLLMQASGVGDMLAKYGVLVDWKLGSVVTNEVFCPLCEELLLMGLTTCSAHIEDIVARTEVGMVALIEALVYAGLTVLIVKNTRTVASIEHNMAHFWDMMHVAYGGNPVPSHGICVGIGFIYTLMYHEMLKNADLSKIDKDTIKKKRMSKQQKKDYLLSCYPPGGGEEIIQANEDWYIDWTENERRIDVLIAYHRQYLKDSQVLPDYRTMITYFERFGAPTSATKAGIPRDRLTNALLCTKDFRKRYSIGQALSELGMIEECAEKVLQMENEL